MMSDGFHSSRSFERSKIKKKNRLPVNKSKDPGFIFQVTHQFATFSFHFDISATYMLSLAVFLPLLFRLFAFCCPALIPDT
jgi:hypothetical protein